MAIGRVLTDARVSAAACGPDRPARAPPWRAGRPDRVRRWCQCSPRRHRGRPYRARRAVAGSCSASLGAVAVFDGDRLTGRSGLAWLACAWAAFGSRRGHRGVGARPGPGRAGDISLPWVRAGAHVRGRGGAHLPGDGAAVRRASARALLPQSLIVAQCGTGRLCSGVPVCGLPPRRWPGSATSISPRPGRPTLAARSRTCGCTRRSSSRWSS